MCYSQTNGTVNSLNHCDSMLIDVDTLFSIFTIVVWMPKIAD